MNARSAGEPGGDDDHDRTWTDLAADPQRKTDVDTDEAAGVERTLDTQPLLPGTIPQAGEPSHPSIGRYEIRGTLGKGGMGVVYDAWDPKLNREIAIKVLRAPSRGRVGSGAHVRLLREAQALAQLSHPNVIAVHDVGSVGGDVFIAMERVHGTTLRKWLAAAARSQDEILEAFLAAGRGLSAAHKAGLVHRDFKPDNVMLGVDGRVRVVDFGLARAPDVDDEPSADAAGEAPPPAPLVRDTDSSENLLESPLTRAGLVVGTPAYMAPEQRRAGNIDARADQFALCASLYEALTGERPFTTDDRKRCESSDAPLPVPPRRPPLSRHMWRVLARGMRTAPGDRYPSVDVLVDELGRAPRHHRTLAIAAGFVVVAAVGGFLVLRDSSAAEPCGDPATAMDRTWGEPQRDAVRAAFATTKLGHAAGTAERAIGLIDGYVRRWSAMSGEVCRAQHVSKTQTPLVASLRSRCLAERRTRLAGLVAVLTKQPDQAVVDRSIGAVLDLPPITDCADETALLGAPQPPDDARIRNAVNQVRDDVSSADGLLSAGRLKAADALSAPLVARARDTGFGPLEAEVLHLRGRVLMKLSKLGAAEKALHAAARAASAAKLDRRLADIWLDLVWCVGELQGRPDEAIGLSKNAGLAIDRAGGAPALRAKLSYALGALSYAKGDLDETYAHFVASLKLRREVLPADHPDVAAGSEAVANAASLIRRPDEAQRYAKQAQAIYLKLYGPDHPDTARGYGTTAELEISRGNLAEAKRLYQKSLAIYQRAYGAGHPSVASATENLGTVFYDMGDKEEGRRLILRALDMRIRALGKGHKRVAVSRFNIGLMFLAENQPAKALSHLRESLAIYESAFAKGHVQTIEVRVAIAKAEMMRGRPSAALGPLTDALRLAHEHKGSPREIGSIEFELARAQWATRRDRRGAKALARKALARMKSSAEPRAAKDAAAMAAWLKRPR